jgi:two-component sensor histidine kinase/putative methionine-R-sulfoxide reductase with GAF domain
MTHIRVERPLEERVVRLHNYQHALAALSRAASESLSLDRLMRHITAQVAGVTHIRRVKIMRFRPEKGDLLVEAGVGWKAGVVGHATLGIDRASPPGRALQTASPVIIEDLPNDDEFRLSDVLRDHGIVSVLNVPVMVDSRTWGVLEVDAETPRTFDEDDITFLTSAANILGIAILRQEVERKAAEAEAELTRLQSRGETLIRELQHRVKNNLQTIISFLALQQRRAESPESRSRLGSVMDRVHAISLAHDQLALKASGGDVELGDYLRSLCANIDPRQEGVSIEVNVSVGMLLSLDRAVPAGLIVNELVTNSLKYAFDEGGGLIRVAFSTDPERGEAHLAVQDNGRGIGEPRPGGLGLTLVSAFAKQLGGKVTREAVEKGTRTVVCFPLPS